MTIHIQKFVDRVRGLESRGQKDFVMPMTDAKDLHADITRLLLTMQGMQEELIKQREDNSVVQVQVDGGNFK